MKHLSYIFLILLTLDTFGQDKGVFSNYSVAFEYPDSVRIISINCLHGNEYGLDGCDSVPSNIDLFQNLTGLYLSETSIRALPNSINKLPRLKHLTLNYSYSLDYENELCKLVGLDSLEFLGLWMARIQKLPDCIGQLKSLKHIDLSQNENLDVNQAFSVFKRLPNLETIDLGGVDNLKAIPKDIQELKNLTTIKLDYLEKGFDYKISFSRLSCLNLESLILANNWLKTLPDELSQLKSLEYIDLSENHFDSIPPQVFQLTNLKEIKIQHNNLSFKQVGKDIGNLDKLEKINLGGNWQLDGQSTIRNLSTLPNLKDLDFFACRLDTIPNEIQNFESLEKLNLTRNSKINFANLFIKLSAVKTLKYLDLGDNKLTTLPKEIGLLTSLEYLNLGQNPIETLPEEFYKLKNLKVLNVYGNDDSKLKESEIEKIKEKLPNCEIITEWIFRN